MKSRGSFALMLLMAAALASRCKAVAETPPLGSVASIADIAKAVSAEVGTVAETYAGGPKRIVLFDETHESCVGQVEIATMLVRLHDHYGLKRVALEGAFADNPPLQAKWFHDLGGGTASQAAAVRLLREGEISACEFAALVYPDLQVSGSEKEAEYAVVPTPRADAALDQYLTAIAEKLLSQDQIVEANRLITENKQDEAQEYILNANAWTKERYARLNDDTHTFSKEEMLAMIGQLQAKASEVGADVDEEMRSGAAEQAEFYRMADIRTHTMVREALALATEGSGIVVMDVGSAHTPLATTLLKEAGATFAVIHPASLVSRDEHGLSPFAYERKDLRASVDLRGLGSFLDGRGNHHKPQPVIERPWLQSKAEIYYAATVLAVAAAGGQKPPFTEIRKQLPQHSVIVDPTSLEVVDDGGQKAVIFKVLAKTDHGTVELWIKAGEEGPPNHPRNNTGSVTDQPPEPERSLEQFLLDEREDLLKEEKTPEEHEGEADAPPREAVLLPISKKVKALAGTSREAVQRRKI